MKEIKTICIITARSGSKGLKDKNIKILGEMPMLAWPISAAMKSKFIERVILSTDSKEYAEIGIKYGAEIPYLRPRELSHDKSSSMDVLLDLINKLSLNDKYTHLLLLEPTSPFTEPEDIESALLLLEQNKDAKSVVGIADTGKYHPSYVVKNNENGFLQPFSSSSFKNMPKRRQDLEPAYFLDGSLYLSEIQTLINEKSFYHEKTIGIELESYKSHEVDDLEDFKLVQSLLKK